MEPPVRESRKSSLATAEELHLLIEEMDDEISSYRWREAVWISIVLHAVLFVVWLTAPRWMPGKIVILPGTESHSQTTFLPLPSDLQHHVKPPKTDIISDKNRIAMTRNPVPNQPRPKIPDTQRPGAPARPSPPPGQQAAQQPAPATQQQADANPVQQQPPPVQTAQAQPPKPPVSSSSSPFKVGSPGSAVEQAIHSAAGSHGTNRVSFGGDYGRHHDQQRSDPHGDLEILSDTMGVDFGPYLQRVVYQVREHWYNLIPESAKAPLMKKGKLTIDFAILKDGRVAGLRLAATSGDDALDRPAWGSITGSDPFPPLPTEFKGQHLQLRFKFYYNPDKNELD
ncbi:MAG TPA: TonB family protein [Candidatus Solibacter sp.]|nr:TonB family protein [Candidatus Solibacter sp.]